MKFSYHTLKQLVPGLPPIAELAEKITLHAFEVESITNDTLEVKILPNRYSDAACYSGLAREIAAICNIPYKEPKTAKLKPVVKKAVPANTSMPNLCRRIATAYVENLRIAPSPDWLKNTLEISGIRSINNLVDITNYVMLETGQPLHPFDYEKIQGGKIIVRQAHDGEIMETLDGKKIALNPSILVLADEKNALDIAGIKGGAQAEITDTTKNIALTAANFDGAVIYKTAKRIGLISDASVRFSHNLNPALVDRGLYRALELIQKLCGGKLGIITDIYPKPIKPLAIICDVIKCNALTGCTLTDKEFFGYLIKLGFTIVGKKATPPIERTDIEGFHDLVEEVARLYGLERITPVAPRIMLTPLIPNAISACKDRARTLAVNAGYTEIYTHSFNAVGEIVLENPLTIEESFLRASLLLGLKKAAEQNLRFTDEVKLFEIGSVFFKKTNHEPEEEIHLGLIMSDKKNNADTNARALRGSVEYLLNNLGIEKYEFTEQGKNALAVIIENEIVGVIEYEYNEYRHIIAEINLTKLVAHRTNIKEYQPIAKYPSITRDLSIVIDKHIRIGKIIECIQKAATHDVIQKLYFINKYEDKKLGENKHSITLRIIFSSDIQTLTDDKVNYEIEQIVTVLKENFQVEIH